MGKGLAVRAFLLNKRDWRRHKRQDKHDQREDGNGASSAVKRRVIVEWDGVISAEKE
jgi:hypothetical protein